VQLPAAIEDAFRDSELTVTVRWDRMPRGYHLAVNEASMKIGFSRAR
jgi:hypothetical protein